MTEKARQLTEELLSLLEPPERTVNTTPQQDGDQALCELVEYRLERLIEGARSIRESPDKLLLTGHGHGWQFIPA